MRRCPWPRSEHLVTMLGSTVQCPPVSPWLGVVTPDQVCNLLISCCCLKLGNVNSGNSDYLRMFVWCQLCVVPAMFYVLWCTQLLKMHNDNKILCIIKTFYVHTLFKTLRKNCNFLRKCGIIPQCSTTRYFMTSTSMFLSFVKAYFIHSKNSFIFYID